MNSQHRYSKNFGFESLNPHLAEDDVVDVPLIDLLDFRPSKGSTAAQSAPGRLATDQELAAASCSSFDKVHSHLFLNMRSYFSVENLTLYSPNSNNLKIWLSRFYLRRYLTQLLVVEHRPVSLSQCCWVVFHIPTSCHLLPGWRRFWSGFGSWTTSVRI